MAAMMVAMTAKSKNCVLGAEKKQGWSIALPELRFPWDLHEDKSFSLSLQGSAAPHDRLFASVGLSTGAPAVAPSRGEKDIKIPFTDHCIKYVSEAFGYQVMGTDTEPVEEEELVDGKAKKKAKKRGLKLKVKIGNPHLRRLVSGAIAGAVSRTCVAPLETIRTHLMVGSNGDSMTEVFQSIMNTEGWTGLFRGNFVNVIRVAPSKAIELFAFDTAKKFLTPKPDESPKTFLPPSLVAGALAGVSSTLCTYPLELIKTRLTIEKDVYDNFLHAFVKILREEGPSELYRGLTPSLIGVVPYAATNYYAYDTLKKLYRKTFKQEEISNIATLLIGSAAGAISSTATFPLEVARKQMQVGAVGGRQVYKNVFHALYCIMEKEGIGGLYKGLGPSCIKLMPAAGISFMCYEACKKILVEDDEKSE
ncbi:adenine nucleotide transporter BT1, chloroplastic/mitochondrial-like [Phragmites australis]|uniref:adenine nucleotide transporter BT1, chloroplastic/mitochondrial-like n=1 Tax=Phragmites australis TaxID=29695 RepID=UPI002D7A3D7D|nr:adenine nucleotide transporter BT1, chloroplastic/mitochondrial-like [Phragmites australis]